MADHGVECGAREARGLLGAAIVINVASSIRETHSEQSDLARIGWVFALLFLPSANLLCYRMLLAYEAGGLAAVGTFVGEPFRVTYAWVMG